MVATGICDKSTGGASCLIPAIITDAPSMARAAAKAVQNCQLGGGLYSSGPGILRSVLGSGHVLKRLALDFERNFVKAGASQNIEHSDNVEVHGVGIASDENFGFRVFIVDLLQAGEQIVVALHFF